MGLLYRLNFASGKSYIGATTQNLNARIRRHELAALGKSGHKFDVHRAWAEFGKPEVILLSGYDTAEELAQAEIEAIDKYCTLYPNGYNLTRGRRTKFSNKTSERRSKAFIGKVFSEEHCRRIAEAAKRRDPSTRKDLSKFWKGKKQSAEHIAKRIRPRGWKHSEETKAKIAAARIK